MPPKQIEFAKLYLTNVVTGKRYIKKLVEQGIVDGWDDPQTGIHRSTAQKRFHTGIYQEVRRAVRYLQGTVFRRLCDVRVLYP